MLRGNAEDDGRESHECVNIGALHQTFRGHCITHRPVCRRARQIEVKHADIEDPDVCQHHDLEH